MIAWPQQQDNRKRQIPIELNLPTANRNDPTNNKINRGTIERIDIDNDPRWDTFVTEHPFGWIYHLSGWQKVLAKSFKNMNGHYFALLDNRQAIIAGLPVYEVKSCLTGRRLVSIPFATLFDPLVSDHQDFTALFTAVLDQFGRGSKTRLEIRTHHAPAVIRDERLICSRFYKHHFLDLSRGPENLRKNFHRSCVRQRIARAEKSNLQLRIGSTETDLRQYYHLHMLTRKNVGRPTQPYRFFQELWRNLQPAQHLTLLLAEKDGIPIAGIILLHFKARVSAEFIAHDERYRDLSPNHFLFWESIRMAYEKGYTIFDFGRTPLNNQPLMKFKTRWGAEEIDLPSFYYATQPPGPKIHEGEPLSYQLMSRVCRKAPGFLQPFIGNFCYRHLG